MKELSGDSVVTEAPEEIVEKARTVADALILRERLSGPEVVITRPETRDLIDALRTTANALEASYLDEDEL